MLFCSVGWETGSGSSISSVTDTIGNTYTSLPLITNSPHESEGFYAVSTSGAADTVTVHFTGSGGTFVGLACGEWSGANHLDVHGEATGTSATPTSASVTPSAPGELLIGYGDDAANNWSATGSWTLRSSATGVRYGLEDQLNSGTGSVASAFSIGSAPWTAGIVAFSDSAINAFIQDKDTYFCQWHCGIHGVGGIHIERGEWARIVLLGRLGNRQQFLDQCADRGPIGNTYTSLPLITNSPHESQGFYAVSASSAADTVTAHFTGGGATYVGFACGEWSGANHLDVHGEATGSSTTPTSASVTPSASGELLIGYADDSGNSWSATGSWTLRSSTGYVRYGLEDQLSSGTSSVASAFSIGSAPWTAGIVAFNYSSDAIQNFTLTVQNPPVAPSITSSNATTFTVGTAGFRFALSQRLAPLLRHFLNLEPCRAVLLSIPGQEYFPGHPVRVRPVPTRLPSRRTTG